MARIPVTGGNGFIGANLVTALVNRGDNVRVLCRSESAGRIVVEACGRAFGASCLPHRCRRPAMPGGAQIRFSNDWLYYDSAKAVKHLGCRTTPFRDALVSAYGWYCAQGYLQRQG